MSSSESNRKRGYTDLLTGSMQLLDIPAPALFKYLMKKRLPSVFLPSFLHEATHFWCMSTDLGATLAMLEMRAQRELALEQFDPQRLLHDFGVTKVIHQLLRPLLEGMALFQEFDAAPGDSHVLSTPGYWAGRLFQPIDKDTPQLSDPTKMREWLTNEIIDRISQYRSSERASHRKMGVLMRSISNDPHYYLAGYLTIKRLWIAAIYSTPAFFDRDLFLSFLRDWIFQDWVLIDYIADANLSCGAAAYLVSERIQRRLAQLATTNLSDEVAAYDREVDDGRRDAATMLWSLHLPEGQAREGQTRQAALLDEILAGVKSGKDENWYFADMLTLSHRQEMMRLALEPVEIEVNEHNRVLVRKNASIESTYLAGSAPEGAERGVTKGWVTAYFLPKYMTVMVIALRENQPMISVGPEEVPENELNTLRFAVTKVIATEEVRREFAIAGRSIVAKYKDQDYESTLEGISAHVLQIYTNYALSLVPEDRLEQVEMLLRRKGLYDVLGKNGDLLTALVKISLMPVLDRSDREILWKLMGTESIALDWALKGLLQCGETTGMPLLMEQDDLIWSVV
jgi:hypothetical protein